MISIQHLPHLNALLNGAAALLLLAGFYSIRRGKVNAHRSFMISALTVSCFFLVSYLSYHAHAGSVRFQKQGLIRPVYFTILISHTVLAVAVLPLVLVTLSRALRKRFDRHRKIARWTLPVWIYVSITGVLVYFMLYHS